jgi:phosphatidylglycerophosphate synthase
MAEDFAGDRKEGKWILARWEALLRSWLLSLVPERVETYHLTLATLLWCFLIVSFSYLARFNIGFLWIASLGIFLQYITDLLDGAVGRERNTGLIKWGFYMDHFLDYIFLCSILIGYSLMVPDQYKFRLFIVLAVFGAFMVSSFLSFAATNEFRISYLRFGPTEGRIMFILFNTYLIVFGVDHLARALPWIMVLSVLFLAATVYRTQKHIWKIDMENKAREGKGTGDEGS